MADRFGTLSLQGGLIKNRHRAYTLEGVRASIDRPRHFSAGQRPPRIRVKLWPIGTASAADLALLVEGPGFSWRVPVRGRKADAAADFAQNINEAARAYALAKFGHHADGPAHADEPSAISAPDLQSDRPELIEHAFSAADHQNRSAAHRTRVVR